MICFCMLGMVIWMGFNIKVCNKFVLDIMFIIFENRYKNVKSNESKEI